MDAESLARDARTVVLVEGESDRAAVLTLAVRCGRDLPAGGVVVVPMGGATNIGHFVDLFGPGGFGVRLAGLCDAGRSTTSAAAWSGPVSARAWTGPGWPRWASSCASPTWRTS